MLACTADSRLKALRVDTELVDGVGSRELAECINGSPMSIASSAAAAAVLAEAGASPLFLGPFLCALGGGDSARITGTSTTSSSSSSSEVSRSSSAAAAAAAAEDGAFSWARIGFGAAGRTCRMVEEDPEPEGRGMGPDEVPASGLAFPLPDFLFLTKMGLGGPGCWTTTFPLSLFVCAAVDAPRARFERVLQKRLWW